MQTESMIKVGDIVKEWWTESSIEAEVEVLNLPRGAGDCIQVRHLKDDMVELINPYCPQFIGFTRSK